MKFKQYLTLGVGIIAGFGISVVGVSYASKNLVSNVKSVTPEVAKSIMLNKVPGANIIEFSYDGDDRIPKYDGTLIKDNYEYEVDVNAKTGEIIKFEKETIFVPNNSGNSNSTSTNTQQSNTQQNTSTSVNNSTTTNKNTSTNVNNSTTTNKNTSTNVNSSTSTNKNTSTNVNNNTTTNKNTSTNVNSSTTTNKNTSTNKRTYIGESKAKSIMLGKVPGATIRKFYLDNDSTPEYDAELVKDGYEYDISVDAYTGAIRDFSKDRIETYDDDRYDDRYDDDRYDDDRYDDDRYDDDRYDDDRYDD